MNHPETQLNDGSRPFVLTGVPHGLDLVVPVEGEGDTWSDTTGEPGRWRLVFDDLEVLRTGATYAVFLDPAGDSIPEDSDPSYLGQLAVFANPGSTPPSSRSFDVTERLVRLGSDATEAHRLRVLLVPGVEEGAVEEAAEAPALSVGAVRLVRRP